MKRISLLVTASVFAFAAACSNTADGVKQDAEIAADKTSDAAENAADKSDAAMETAQIKSALIADSRIDSDDINVDTNKDTKTVTLNGTVPTEAMKTLAAEVAASKAEGFAVVNNLTIKPE